MITIQKTNKQVGKEKQKEVKNFSDLKTLKTFKIKEETKKLPKVKSKISVLGEDEKKSLSNFNSKRKKNSLKPVDEISYESYLNFKNSLSLIIKREIKLEYDVFEAIVKKYKIKTV